MHIHKHKREIARQLEDEREVKNTGKEFSTHSSVSHLFSKGRNWGKLLLNSIKSMLDKHLTFLIEYP